VSDDITTRLRRWTHAADAVPASDLMDEAADEIERLRLELFIRPTPNILVQSPRPTLTDAEREAVEQAIDAANGMGQAEPWTMRALRGLLERLQ